MLDKRLERDWGERSDRPAAMWNLSFSTNSLFKFATPLPLFLAFYFIAECILNKIVAKIRKDQNALCVCHSNYRRLQSLINIFYLFSREDMRNSFNLLLIALICMDSCFLITSFLDCFRKGFNMITYVHYMMFPYFLFPFMSIAVTGSIFMTVAIAFERYWAVHYPIDYSQVSFG